MSNARDKANIPALNFSSTGIDDNATSTAITIDSGERVGIGTTSPYSILNGRSLSVHNSSGASEINLLSSTSGFGALYFGDGTSGNTRYAGYIEYKHDDDYFRFATNSTEKMRIDSSGNVGIGDTSPNAKLDVRSQINVTNANGYSLQAVTGTRYGYSSAYKVVLLGGSGTSTSDNIAIGYDPSGNTSGAFSGDGRELLFRNGVQFTTPLSNNIGFNTNHLVLKDGNVGIGTSSPLATLHVDTSNSGVTSLNGASDDFLIESSGGTGMTIASGTGDVGRIAFADSGNNLIGYVQYDHGNNAMSFQANGSERMRIDGTTGNVGIGLTGATYRLQLTSVYETADSPKVFKAFNNSAGSTSSPEPTYWDMGGHGGADRVRFISYDYSGNSGTRSKFVIQTSVDGGSLTERFAIQNDGDVTINNKVGIGNSNPNYTLEIGNAFSGTGASINLNNNVGHIRTRASLTDTQTHHAFVNPNGTVGTIKTVSSSTSFNTSSDYRLKENVNYDFDATTRLKQLKPARFNFIADADTTVDGFLAHEVSDIVPEAITGTKDAVDADGNPEYQGIDQSKLVPLLVKTIQELEARITTLEANNP